MRKKSNNKKNKKVEMEDVVVAKEVGTFDDFVIYEKEDKKEDKKGTKVNSVKGGETKKEPKSKNSLNDLSFLKDWVELDNPFRNKDTSKKSRFEELFKEIKEEENKKKSLLDSKEEDTINSNSLKKDDSLKKNSSINSSSAYTYQSSGTGSKILETSLNEISFLDNNNSSINQINENINKIVEPNEKIEEVNLVLDINKVISLEDKRTTIMIKNIPNKFNKDLLLSIINQNFKGTYDLFILPTDINKYKNFGYAFINFTCSYYIPYFYYMFNGKMWSNTNSRKVCELTYSKVQEKENLLKHYPSKIIYANEEAFNVTPEQKYIIPNVYKLIFNKYFQKEQIEEYKFYFITKMPTHN